MLKEEEYFILKNNFSESQRLFNKLLKVAKSAADIDYDESGLYGEEEEMYERHWLTLSSKIVNSLSKSLDGFNIELLQNDSLETQELRLNLKNSETTSKICVNYSQDDSISITQIS